MATNLFKRREVEMEFIAVEKINLFYNLFTTLLIIIFYNRLSDPQSMLMGRFMILVICLHKISVKIPHSCENGNTDAPAQLLVPRHV